MPARESRQFGFARDGRRCLGAALLALAALAAPILAERLPLKIYTVENGLSQDIVNRVVRDSRGFLWFCTEDGLSRFDGQVFVNYDTSAGLPHPQVNHLLETRDGRYYLATNGGGVVRFATGAPRGGAALFQNVPIESPPARTLEANRVNFLYEDRAGTIWAGTFIGLFRLENDGAREIFRRVALTGADLSVSVRGFAEDGGGALWMWTRNGLFRRDAAGRVTRYEIAPGDGYDPLRAVVADPDGRLFVAHESAGLFVFAGARLPAEKESYAARETSGALLARYGRAQGWPVDSIYALHRSADGRLRIGTATGISESDGAAFRHYGRVHGLPETPYNWLGEDAAGNLWATTNQGAVKLTRGGFVTYGETEGLGVRGVRAIWENAAGALQVLTPRGTFHQLDGESFAAAALRLPGDATFDFPQNVLRGGDGRLWAATKNGLYRFAPVEDFRAAGASAAPEKTAGLPGDFITRLFADARGDLWIALAGAAGPVVCRRRADGTIERFGVGDGLPADFSAAVFAEDAAAATVWIGSADGRLARRRGGGRFEVFTNADGLPFGQIQDLYLDRRGELWIATRGGGVARLARPRDERLSFAVLTTKNGLSSDNVTAVVEDEWGRVYLGTGRGLDWIEAETGRAGRYSTIDGLHDNKIEIAYRDRRGRLWFGTANTLARYTPAPPEPASAPPKVFITRLRLNGVDRPLAPLGETEIGEIELDAGGGQVVIEFSGIDFTTGKPLRFQHRLLGTRDEWSEPAAARAVNFADLAAGRYRFLVRAVLPDGTVSETPAAVGFRILPPFYLRWWFIAAALAAVGAAIYLFYRARLKRLLELERMRNRIATDLHDDIGANLTRISLLSEVAARQAAAGDGRQLDSIAAIARESVASMNDIVWAISPEHDRLLDLTRRMRLHAEDLFALRDVELDFRAPAAETDLHLGVGVRRDLLLIFKEAVNNAARHSGCARAEVDFRVEDGVLRLLVADDGRGFATAAEHDGHGLKSLRRRAAALGGALRVESGDGGTRVVFELPLARAKNG